MDLKLINEVESKSSMKRDDIVKSLINIVGAESVLTDIKTLQENSTDRFRKYTNVHGIYIVPIPAAVVKAKSTSDISKVLKFCNDNKINCVPRTGATATEGGLETIVKNSVVLDGSSMNKIIKIDLESMQVTGECGVILGELEDKLRSMGYTTGHSPQCKPLAQLGGLTATRSTGQLSTLYGGIEDMIVGLEAVFADGTITRIKNTSRRAAGPDIRHVIIGNEGALCYITEVTMKLYKYMPENHKFFGWTLDNFSTGLKAIREIIINGYRPSVSRIYSEEDARQHFSHFAGGKCVLLFMAEGPKGLVSAMGDEIENVVSKYSECKQVDSKLIETWFNDLCWGQDKIDNEKREMFEEHKLGYTTEVSGLWGNVEQIYENSMRRIREEFPLAKDLTMLGAHSSHSYQNGTNLYFVYDYNINCPPEGEITQYHMPINAIIVEETLKAGGAMVHHHGIGKYRTQWTAIEHGSAVYILNALKKVFDPNNIMNKGTIYPIVD